MRSLAHSELRANGLRILCLASPRLASPRLASPFRCLRPAPAGALFCPPPAFLEVSPGQGLAASLGRVPLPSIKKPKTALGEGQPVTLPDWEMYIQVGEGCGVRGVSVVGGSCTAPLRALVGCGEQTGRRP